MENVGRGGRMPVYVDDDNDVYFDSRSCFAEIATLKHRETVEVDARVDDYGTHGLVTLAVDDGASQVLTMHAAEARRLSVALLRAAEFVELAARSPEAAAMAVGAATNRDLGDAPRRC